MNKVYVEPMFVDLLMKTNLSDVINNNDQMVSRCQQIKDLFPYDSTWFCDTYNSLQTYNLKDDQLFKPLIDLCTDSVIAFSKQYGINSCNVSCTDAWFNVASPGNFQEFHIHNRSHFSVVYYASVVEGSGSIIFKNLQTSSDMFPLPKGDMQTTPNNTMYKYKPFNQDLLIFRSNLPHMVEKNNSSVERVSISMNYILE